ncbi:MAG: transcriptional regulator, partial [Sedimenticola sp.]
MPTSRQIAFLSTSIAAGLVAAIIALSLQPDKTAEVMQSAPPPTVISSGPASYADAVKKAAPSVVNIYT